MRGPRTIKLLCGLVMASLLGACGTGMPAHRSQPASRHSVVPGTPAPDGPQAGPTSPTPPTTPKSPTTLTSPTTPATTAPRPTGQDTATAGGPGRRVTRDAATRTLARMSERQRVGQLFMVGNPATHASRATLSQISAYHVGNVILTGRSHRGVAATASVVAALQSAATRAATGGVGLLVATDQEGGEVQVLAGSGFSQIPSALEQGRWSPHRLRARARRWGGQLRRAGVNTDLSPVLDTVPGPRAARRNAPIGAYDREYGFRPGTVARHGVAFARGLLGSGVAATAKHFPGLGRVRRNTDWSSGVTDRTTRRGDPYLVPFRDAVRAGVPLVMVATAYYRHLDPARPAAFSPVVIRRMLRGDLGFRGVVVSDDLGQAAQVSRWSYAQRAVKFLSAGGDLVLVTVPRALPPMYDAVLRRARRHPAFRRKVDHAALLVLQVKQRQRLLTRAR